MSRSPNEEQLAAINKMDGVLLSAGAGSGKTFVIIEHIIKKIYTIKEKLSSHLWNEEVGSELSKIVLMTFTKKASGEMSVRLLNRIEELINEDKNNEVFWKIIHKNLNRIQVSTIHGFCHRLLGFGFWPEIPSKIELLNSFSHNEKIKKLFKKWLIANSENLSSLYLSHSSDLLQAMIEIFSSPELRLMWEKGKIQKDINFELESFFIEWNRLRDYSVLFNRKSFLSLDPKKKEKKGYGFLCDFYSLIEADCALGVNNYKKLINFIEATGRFPTALKDFTEEEIEYRLAIKNIFNDLKDLKNDLVALEENYQIYIEWENILLSAFDFINVNYLTEPGFAFSDLEYYSLKGLRSGVSQEKIQKMFACFVVDEFQDTSPIQFEILKLLIANDYSKLFCVGDKKQAIYGFRGGELAVFSECSSLLGANSNLSLKSNYRSLPAIVNFNNDFFKQVFMAGLKYEGIDNFSVEMEFQSCEGDKLLDGEVLITKIGYSCLDNDEVDIDLIEAKTIIEMIKEDLKDEKIKEIAILYRKLRPSRYLIDFLRNEKLSFTAQVKINFEDDPIISFFKHAIHYLINFDDEKKRSVSEFHLCSLASLVGVHQFDINVLEIFYKQFKVLGLSNAFWKMIYTLGITNSEYIDCTTFIENIINLAEDNILKINKLLTTEDGDYSTEIISGTGKRINIMSTHASKGLEFDSVIIGGIHRNGSYEGIKSKVGKMPKSFKWKKNYDQRKYFKSPFFHLESEITALKDFSESKRLFYVATTRAVKKLRWADISINGQEASFFSNSWINAFRKFSNNNSLRTTFLELNNLVAPKDVSLIQKDSMGILYVPNLRKLGIISELSVTRLSLIEQCPFKFYLKNICKIEETFVFDQFEGDADEILSSKKRGSFIHNEIAQVVTGIKEPNDDMSKWVMTNLNILEPIEVISEKEMKFSFFGQMITAIPDLIVVNKNGISIWDFKTGAREEMDEDAYWFQLSAYAYGYSLINLIDQDFEIDLSLLYLDQKVQVSKRLNLKDITRNLFRTWTKADRLDQVNTQHCRFCSFSNICKSSSVVASI